MLDLYKILRMVEDEIAEMKVRQQTVLAGYQQQTREDIVKKFVEADHSLLEAAERKVKQINELKYDAPYLVTSAKKVSYLSARRVKGENDLTVEIDPIIYPTPFNLKFVLNEPSVGLYSPSTEKGTFSMNNVTSIRTTDMIQTLEVPDLERYIDLWVTHKADDSFIKKLRTMQEKVMNVDNSAELLVESMLAMSSPTPARQLIYICEDHDKEPTHKHEKTIPQSAVKGLVKHHLKIN
jgi:hypothetical protein